MDTLVNYQVVNTQEVKDKNKIEAMQEKEIKKYSESGSIIFKVKQFTEGEPIPGSGCEAGVCPVKTQ